MEYSEYVLRYDADGNSCPAVASIAFSEGLVFKGYRAKNYHSFVVMRDDTRNGDWQFLHIRNVCVCTLQAYIKNWYKTESPVHARKNHFTLQIQKR